MLADPSKSVVEIKGWNYAKDVLDNGIAVQTMCENVWL